jgi:hypothetical protein
MNKSATKALRNIIDPSSPISKKVFRRLKKLYNRTPNDQKANFKTQNN